MALIRCDECGRDVSDKAAACPGCGAPVDPDQARPVAPEQVSLRDGHFCGTKRLVLDLAAAAIGGVNYRIDSRDDAGGTISFTTGMTMGSWSGVSGTLALREVEPYVFEVTGQAKQNVKGGQMVALNLFDEANGKVRAVIEEMQRRVAIRSNADRPSIPPRADDGVKSDADTAMLMIGIVFVALVGIGFLAIQSLGH